ncbi:hypothetical protein ACLBXX_09465 [Microbacterium sp. C23T]
MATSFPEKTFEHWISQYIAYRFRTHLGQWWPAAGADVEIEPTMLPIGKSIWLELKTATPAPANPRTHDVEVDVPQLLKYHQPGNPPVYYVVPRPGWTGSLGTASAASWLSGTSRSDLAFKRAQAKWFGNWTMVVAGWSLRSAVASNGAGSQKTAKLGHWDGSAWTWGPSFKPAPGASHPQWTWPEFWNLWQSCGSPLMPSTLVVPSPGQGGLDVPGQDADRAELTAKLRAYRDERRADHGRRALDFGRRSIYEPVFEVEGDRYLPTSRLRLVRTVEGVETNQLDGAATSQAETESSMLAMMSARDIR